MEFLENRLLLAQDVWTGGGDGTTWQNGQNWSLNRAPGASDSALITVSNSLTIVYNGNSSIQSITDDASNGASAAIDITGGSLTVTSGASQTSGALTVAPGATLSASGSGTTFTETGAATLSGANLYASGGAVMAFPTLTALAGPSGINVSIQASGTSGPNGTGTPSEIDLSHVTSLTGTSNNVIFFNAYSGGEVNLSHLASNPSGRNFFQVSGTGSVLDLSALSTVVSDQGNDSEINIGAGGTLLDPLLTTLDRTDLSVDGSATVATAQITSIAGSQVFASDGAVIAFPLVTALSTLSGVNLTIQASGTSGPNGTGTPSEVDLSHVTTLTGTSNNVIFFNAYSGGELNLSHLASNPSGRNFFQVSGTGSVLDLSSLATVVSDQGNDSQINIGAGGTLLDPLLTTLDRTDLSVDGSATVATAQITSIAGSQVFASDGAVIAFPLVTALATLSGVNLTIQASGTSGPNGTGTPSEVDLSHVTTLTGTSNNVIFFNAYSGGELNLSHLASNPSGRNFFQVSGTGSVLDLSSLATVVSDQGNDSQINIGAGGTLLDPLLTTLDRTDLSVDGSATVATAQITSIAGSQVFASDGAVIAFPLVTALSTLSGVNLTIQASGTSGPNGTGTPSEVDLSHVTTLTGTSNNVIFCNAYSGGELNLSHLASNPSGRNFFQVSGTGSVLDLSALPAIVSDQSNNSLLSVTSGGTVVAPLLTTLTRTDLTIDATATIPTGQFTSYTGATITVNSGTPDFSGLTSISGDDVYASGGAVVAFPNVTTLSTPTSYEGTIQASGTSGSGGTGTPTEVDLSHLTTLTGTTNDVYFFNAYSGGEIDLSHLTSNPSGRNFFQVSGTGSVLDLSALPAILSDQSNNSLLSVTSGGTVLAPLLTTLTRTDLTIDGTATIPTRQFTSYTGATITVNSGTPDFSGLTSISGDDVYANGGAVVAFPNVTVLSTPTGYEGTIQASGTSGSSGTGTPSEIDLSHVTTLTGTTNFVYFFNAYSGGEIDLSRLTSNPSGRNFFQVSGTGSVLDLSALPAILSDQSNNSLLSVTSGGTVVAPLLTTLTRTDLTIDATATIPTGQFTSFTGATITVNSGTPNFTGLTSISGDDVYANGGAVVAFPNVTSLSTPTSYEGTIQASGTSGSGGTATPSEVDLSHVTTLTGTTNFVYFFNAYSGGEIDLNHLTSNPSGRNFFQVSGTGSVLDLSSLPAILSDQANNSLLSADSSGEILLNSGTVTLSRVDVTVTNGGTITGGTLRLSGGTLSGTSSINASVTSAGTTSPGSNGIGVLTIDGSFTQYGAGALDIQVGGTTAGTEYDQLAVTGAVQLGGTIAISLANGFTPQVGNQFSVITYRSQSGEFSTYGGLAYAAGDTFQTDYTASDFTLVAAKADVRVFPTTGLFTSKAGDYTSFTVVLATQPTANVTLNLSSSNTSEGTVSPASLTFTTADWNVAQTVTVTGVNDQQSGSTPYQVNFAPAVSSDTNYSGLTPVSVSLTNLPNEVLNIAAANLAVSPSTGLNQGSTLAITWNDSNTGNVPAAASWNDQVVITNTTKGDTLLTALVPVDPDVVGVLDPGAFLAQQYSFTLPEGADGVGNLQVTVTANVDHSAFESGTSLTNANLRSYSNGGDYPAAPTTLSVGGVDFALIPDGTTASSVGILQTGPSGSSFDIPVNIAGGTVLSTLINSAYGIAGDTVGTVEVKGTGGADATFSLVEGTNIRDHNNDGYENSIAPGTPSASFGNGQVRLDMQTFTLPAAFATARITDIILTSSGGVPQGEPFLAAATVTTSSGPAQLVLLGRGVAPDVTNNATTTVVSGNVLPGQVSIALDPGSDSGVKGDDLTNDMTPAFDVTVNEAGLISVDFKGDGTSLATQTVVAAGTYMFTSPDLADGTYTTKVTFTPSGGTAVTSSTMTTIDTLQPQVVAGLASEQAPEFTRTLTFNKAMDSSTLSPSTITLLAPNGATVPISSIIGSGTTYVLNFSPLPIYLPGVYTVDIGSGVTDRAGNKVAAPRATRSISCLT